MRPQTGITLGEGEASPTGRKTGLGPNQAGPVTRLSAGQTTVVA